MYVQSVIEFQPSTPHHMLAPYKPGRVLISVWNKQKLEQFLPLAQLGWEFVATPGSAAALKQIGIVNVIPTCNITHFPECFGMVRTISPRLVGTIVADRQDASHLAFMTEFGMRPIDIVAVNVKSHDEGFDPRRVDMGAFLLLRAAASNRRYVTAAPHPTYYEQIVTEIVAGGGKVPSPELRVKMATIAFQLSASYDQLVARWMDEHQEQLLAELQ